MAAYIALENGTIIEGQCRSPGYARGELVFTTAYTGYEESLTDPSYTSQILTFAYPLIGNYGVREDRFESNTIHPEAVLAREFDDSVQTWLSREDVPAIDTLDTRAIVRLIREEGAMECGIAAGPDVTPEDAISELDECTPIEEQSDIAETASRSSRMQFGDGTGPKVCLVDCGAKQSIITSLVDRGATVYTFPYDSSIESIAKHDPDLLFISNGPGNPEQFKQAQRIVSWFTGEVPITGICLGQQVIALALGGETEKLPFGHRGVNQPVQDLRTEQVFMTTQNHGYNVSECDDLEITQVNVNDGTAEALASDELCIHTRQYHPEARPGPRDSLDFFSKVLNLATQP